MNRARVLAVDDDAVLLRALEEGLTQAGFEVIAVREAIQAVPRAKETLPDLVLVDRHMPVLNGSEIVRALRAFPQTARIPVAFFTADDSAQSIVRSVKAGAVDVLLKPLDVKVFTRLADLLEEVDTGPLPRPVTPEAQARVLLDVFRREKREGVLRLNPGTPFEGRAVFDQGELRGAELGPARGITALEEMISFEDGLWRFDPGLPEETTDKVVRPDGPPMEEIVELAGEAPLRILLVDDEADLRRLFQIQLRKSGFVVDLAEDGREGAQLARANDYDLMIADLNMPRLDGWGMLRELRADFRTRELPVIFLSAHDDYRETLRAAKSGAWDYLPKTGRADHVIQRTLQALLPRQRAVADLLVGDSAEVDLGVLGPRWMLKTLAAHKATGTLEVKDDWATYRFTVQDGAPLSAQATAQGAKRNTTGISAVGALLVSRGARGHFRPGKVRDVPQFESGMEQLLDTACTALNELEGRALSRRLEQGGAFEVDADLYALYRRVSSDRELQIARAVCEDRIPAPELSSRLALPPEVVEDGLTDLLRRRVIRFVAKGG